MMRLLILGVTLLLAACASMPGGAGVSATPVRIDDAIAVQVERVAAEYERGRFYADLIVPFLPVARQAQVRAAEASVEAALDEARLAITAEQQLAALLRARDEMAKITAAAATAPSSS